MLTEQQIEALRHIRDGHNALNEDHATGLVDDGYAYKEDGNFRLTDRGEQKLRLLPHYGEALVNILIPGAGVEQAVEAAAQAEAKRPKEYDENGDLK